MKATILLFVIGAIGRVTEWLVQGQKDLEITGRVDTIQITELLRPARILRSILETWKNLLSLKLQWKP